MNRKPTQRLFQRLTRAVCLIAVIGLSALSGGAISSSFAASDGWRLSLKVSVPDSSADSGLASNTLVAGAVQTATSGFDAWDIRALLAGPVQAYFAHWGEGGYDAAAQQLWQDFRAVTLPAEWRIEVTAESGRTVTVSWTLPAGAVSCATNQFSLLDADGQLGQTDLCAAGSLTYAGDGMVRHFVLRVS